MRLAKAQRAVEKAEAQRARARESLITAIILEEGANPRKVRKIKVDSFRSLLGLRRRELNPAPLKCGKCGEADKTKGEHGIGRCVSL